MKARRKRYLPGPPGVPPAQLSQLFQALARAAAAAALGSTAACSQLQGDGEVGQAVPRGAAGGISSALAEGWTQFSCGESGTLALGPLMPTRDLDYLGLYDQVNNEFVGNSAFEVATHGSRCATAAAPGDCQTMLAELTAPTPNCTLGTACPSFAVETTGDDAARIFDPAELPALLGTIDTPGEAVAVAHLSGQKLQCGDTIFDTLGTAMRASDAGFELRTDWHDCGVGVFPHTVEVDAEGNVEVLEDRQTDVSNCTVGRRPPGLRAALPRLGHSRLGTFFASAAHLEAASVHSFERLARELKGAGAPRALIAEASVAALDEVRHARVVTALARRFGGQPAPVELDTTPRCARREC